MPSMELRTAFWVTKEGFGVYRVEATGRPSSRCILDRNTMQVRALRTVGSRLERTQLGNDPISKAVRQVEKDGIQEGETRVILVSDPPGNARQVSAPSR